MQICQASSPEQIAEVSRLFQEFADWLQVDLCFQGFAAELASLPGGYAPPRGRLLLATDQGAAAGCVALRPFGGSVCEMKRLFVRPAYQGRGFGRALAQRLITDAKTIGYASMVLDTLPFMRGAIGLYEQLGFVRRSDYYDTPLKGTVFMELQF